MSYAPFFAESSSLPDDCRRVWVFLGFLLLLAGCAAPLAPGMVRQSEPVVPFADLKKNPDLYQGKTVILGGEVLSLTFKEGEGILQVEQKPLDSRRRPLDDSPRGGVFQVVSSRWLDQDAYIPRRKVTVVGVVLGGREELPTLRAQEIYLWEDPRRLDDFLREWFEPELHEWFTPPYFDPWKGSW